MSDIVEQARRTDSGGLIAKMADEIERLQGACKSYEVQANRDAIEIERRAKSIEEAMTQLAWKDDEIEKLRELLREMCAWYVNSPTGVGSDLFERVHEALGGGDEQGS